VRYEKGVEHLDVGQIDVNSGNFAVSHRHHRGQMFVKPDRTALRRVVKRERGSLATDQDVLQLKIHAMGDDGLGSLDDGGGALGFAGDQTRTW
jgi:hypothetical protein